MLLPYYIVRCFLWSILILRKNIKTLLKLYHVITVAHYNIVDSGSTSAILDKISEITPENCEGGANNAIDLVPKYSLWEESTHIARLTSNLMTSIILRHHGSVDSLTDELYYDVIKNNVAGQSKIVASPSF